MVTVTPRPVVGHRLAALGLSVVLVLHGIAHFAGLVDSLDKADAAATADYLGGAWTISDPALLRAVGVAWAVVGATVILSAVLVLLRHRLARPVVLTVLAVSLTLSFAGLPAAVIGVVLNLVLLAVVAVRPSWVGLGPS